MNETQSPNGERCFAIFVTNIAQIAANSAADRVNLDSEAEEQARKYPDELRTEIEAAVFGVLSQFSARHSILKEQKLLRPVASISIIAPSDGLARATTVLQGLHDQDRSDYSYYTREYGYVSDNAWRGFRQKFIVGASVRREQREQSYVACILKTNGSDTSIWKELPRLRFSRLEDIASLIVQQPEGMKGFLLTNGRANVFYLEGNDGIAYAIRVRWDYRDSCWRIREWPTDKFGIWWADDQIICPGTIAS